MSQMIEYISHPENRVTIVVVTGLVYLIYKIVKNLK
jgi:hypothetical protein